ncbi:hypothetical protein HU200_004622 [Digitaria exilis]|uniref:RING-type domain-containing protein n=1 Tax=Digitaria exilis TaxID=1010633 RepID=A0A835FRW3_9POAL|nr:hypothetical protein HU200_004622 [Digitaria exilis]
MDAQQLHARRLLSHAAVAATSAGPSQGPAVQEQVQVGGVHARAAAAAPFSSLNATVITVLSMLLCGLVVVLAVHVIVRCAFRVTRRVCYGQEEPPGGDGAASSYSCQDDPRRKGGRSRRALPPPVVYRPEIELAGCGAAECAICLTEFAHGDRVRALPHCNHGFHVRCIDRWLAARQTCPTCRRAPFAAVAKPSAPEAVEELQVRVDAGAGQTETR